MNEMKTLTLQGTTFEVVDAKARKAINQLPAADIDVTATVGQTIIVKEVDANGKPTKWESADYQPRTHYDTWDYIIPETTIEGSGSETIVDELLVDGETYVVNWEGVEYTCVCVEVTADGMTLQTIGNAIMLDGEDTGEPFIIATTLADGNKVGMIAAVDDTVTSFTFSLKGKKPVPIPVQYVTNAFPYYIKVTGSGTDDDPYVCNDTVANVEAIYKSGRSIVVKHRETIIGGSETGGVGVTGYTENILSLISVTNFPRDLPYGLAFSFFCGGMTSGATSTGEGLNFIPNEDGAYTIIKHFG